jgi:hypothetical protein
MVPRAAMISRFELTPRETFSSYNTTAPTPTIRIPDTDTHNIDTCIIPTLREYSSASQYFATSRTTTLGHPA